MRKTTAGCKIHPGSAVFLFSFLSPVLSHTTSSFNSGCDKLWPRFSRLAITVIETWRYCASRCVRQNDIRSLGALTDGCYRKSPPAFASSISSSSFLFYPSSHRQTLIPHFVKLSSRRSPPHSMSSCAKPRTFACCSLLSMMSLSECERSVVWLSGLRMWCS